MSIYIKSGSIITVSNENDITVLDSLPNETFSIHKNTMTGELFLKRIETISVYGKLYGDTQQKTDRIMNTFVNRKVNTGVILSGVKGSGKTLLAKNIAVHMMNSGYPVIIVSEPLFGKTFNEFIQSIKQPCMVFFDEFEKVYDRNDQDQLLTLFDGTAGGKNLYVVTCNDKYRVSEYFDNRPGRFFYSLTYTGVSETFIREYCDDNLNNKNHIDDIVNISGNFDSFTFDMLQAMVEEMNRYDETVIEVMEYLNTSMTKEYSHWEVVESDLSDKYKDYEVDNELNYGNRFNIFGVKSFTIRLTLDEDRNITASKSVISKDDCYDPEGSDNHYFDFSPSDIEEIKNGVITVSYDGCVFKIAKKREEKFDFSKYLL